MRTDTLRNKRKKEMGQKFKNIVAATILAVSIMLMGSEPVDGTKMKEWAAVELCGFAAAFLASRYLSRHLPPEKEGMEDGK